MKEIPGHMDMSEEALKGAKATREAMFRYELKALLEKWGAGMSAEDHYTGWPECGEDIRITAELNSPWQAIDLGKWI